MTTIVDGKARQSPKDSSLKLYYICLGILVLALLFEGGSLVAYDPSNVITIVNITNALPWIDAIQVNNGTAINLTEGGNFNLLCNVTIRDYAGLSNMVKVNATYHRQNVSAVGAADNNTRYFNYNCSYNFSVNWFTFQYYCWFPNLTYYAFNGSWNCTVWALNTLNVPVNSSNSSIIYPLFAINVTDVVNFGNMAVLDTSAAQTVNVTNFGNMHLNLTLYGYGGTSNSTGGGKAFHCPFGTNISVDNLRWTYVNGSISWDNMVNLTSGPKVLQNITIWKQTTDAYSYNTTYWKLYVPPNPFGLCNGTIVYEATAGPMP